MKKYRVTYTDDRADEVVEAERVTVEGSNGLVALRKTVMVIGQPREVVVRRIVGAAITAVDGWAHREQDATEPCPPRSGNRSVRGSDGYGWPLWDRQACGRCATWLTAAASSGPKRPGTRLPDVTR